MCVWVGVSVVGFAYGLAGQLVLAGIVVLCVIFCLFCKAQGVYWLILQAFQSLSMRLSVDVFLALQN